MFKAAYLIIDKFASLLQAVHLVYRITTAVQCGESHVKHFDGNGQFVHLLEVF